MLNPSVGQALSQQNLGGSSPNPRNSSGVAKSDVMYVVFPHTAKAHPVKWPVTADGVRDALAPLLASVGGKAALLECAPG